MILVLILEKCVRGKFLRVLRRARADLVLFSIRSRSNFVIFLCPREIFTNVQDKFGTSQFHTSDYWLLLTIL